MNYYCAKLQGSSFFLMMDKNGPVLTVNTVIWSKDNKLYNITKCRKRLRNKFLAEILKCFE